MGRNSINRATSAEKHEESKMKIKALRSEIYNRLDKTEGNAFQRHGDKAETKIQIKDKGNDKNIVK